MDWQSEPIMLLNPDREPVETGYLYALFAPPMRDCSAGVPVVDGLQAYYCASNQFIASEILNNQIKPLLGPEQSYAVWYPISDYATVEGTHTLVTMTAAMVHFSHKDDYKSEAAARRHVIQLLEYFRQIHNRYITGMQIMNTDFSEWSDDNSDIQQYTAIVSISAIFPNFLSPECK